MKVNKKRAAWRKKRPIICGSKRCQQGETLYTIPTYTYLVLSLGRRLVQEEARKKDPGPEGEEGEWKGCRNETLSAQALSTSLSG